MYKVYAFHINSCFKQIDEFRYCRNIGPFAMIIQVSLFIDFDLRVKKMRDDLHSCINTN